MLAELVALVASVCTALSSVMATRGMRDSNPDTANLVLTGIQAFVLTGLLLWDVPGLNLVALGWFALAGVLGSFVGRLFTMISYKRIGVSGASALIGTSPVVTIFLAVVFLSEPLRFMILLGGLLVFGGVALINLRGGELSLDWGLVYLPLVASFFYALSNIIRKLGTNILPHAVLGAQVSTVAGLVACGVYVFARGGFRLLQVNKQNIRWLGGAGVVNALAWVMVTRAINLGRVSVASSIIYSYPLFSMLLSWYLLGDEELTGSMVFGSVLIVLGVAVVSLFG